jgi:hypothetical protein
MSADASDFPPGRWQARWIWCEPPRIAVAALGMPVLDETSAPRWALLRRAFELAAAPRDPVLARFTSDSRHVVWVNGVEVARGPVRGDPRCLRYDVADLGPQLRAGRNALAVLVCFYRRATPWWMPAVPSFDLGAGAFCCEVRLPGGEVLASDRSWRALASDAWTPLVGHGISAAPLECLDARRLPPGWQGAGFDDSAWTPALELGAAHIGTSGEPRPPSLPYGALLRRPIPQLGGVLRDARPVALQAVPDAARCDDPVRQVDDDARAARQAPGAPAMLPLHLDASAGVTLVTLDVGEETAGTVLLEVEAAPGTRFDVSVAESVDGAGRLHRLQQHNGFRYVARGGADRFESFDPMGLRFLQVSVRDATAPVVLRRAAVRERLFPRPPGAEFACSDPLLTRLWQVGRRTVDLCSHDAYLDCPSREQRAWTGDSVVHQMVDLATNPDWRLARWHVELTASPRPDGMLPMAVGGDMAAADATYIPDWPLHWVRALHNLHRYTGDRALVARLLPIAESLLRWFEPFQRADGLLADVTGWVLIDWSAVGVAGACAALNALWARALRDFADMATWLGDGGRAAWARSSWQRVAGGFDAFWDEGRGVYVDNLRDGVAARAVSQHTNAAALCAALVAPERIPRVLRMLLDRACLVRASWLLPGQSEMPADGDMYAGAAYLLAGPPEPWWDVERQVVAAQPFFRYVVHDAVALAGRADRIAELCRDWQPLLARSATTFSETWFGGSHCHGWSACPTRDLVVYTLGVTPAEPGYAVARIAPRLGDLDWARGSVPTPYGLLHVEARRDGLTLDSPVPVELALDDGTARRLGAGRHEWPAAG